MTTTLERSYQPLQTYEVEGPDETPHEIHVVPEGSKSEFLYTRIVRSAN
jgi:hypothetical protein